MQGATSEIRKLRLLLMKKKKQIPRSKHSIAFIDLTLESK